MRKLAARLIGFGLMVALAPVAWSICDLPPPAEDEPDLPTEPPPPQFPTTPPPGGPDTPPDTPAPTPTPRPTTPSRPNPRGGTGRTGGANYGASWRIWWELNREHMLGLRQTIASKDVVSSGSGEATAQRRAAYRQKVRAALRVVADRAQKNSTRAAALRALGRAGDDDDARRFLLILKRAQQPTELYESAAIGLGCLPPIKDPALRLDVLAFFDELMADRVRMPSRSRRVAILALSLRGRNDPILAQRLAVRFASSKRRASEGGTLLYACGITRDPFLLPVLIDAVSGKKSRGRKLNDIARGRATLGLALSGYSSAVTVLSRILTARSTQVQTRRSAAIGLGMLLRSDRLTRTQTKQGNRALLRAFDRDRDRLVQGYAAVAMGTSHTPIGVAQLKKAVDGGDRIVRPYAALALGLRAMRDKDADKLRAFLVKRLHSSKDIERTAALSIAVGISGAKDARDHLFACLKRKRLTVGVRAPAIQGLGLLRQPSSEIENMLTLALDDKSNTVVEDASLALGFLGRRTTARLLVRKLVETKSTSVQVHMVAALSHLGSTAAIDPLLEVLSKRSHKHTMRESAAAALGILVDHRADDPLFEIDAFTNPYGLTGPGRSLVLVY